MAKIKEAMTNRAKLYSFFSRLYREEADKELLESLKSDGKPPEIEGDIAREYGRLRQFLGGVEINKEFMDELAADYAALFLGIGRHPAHPYESVYNSKDKIVMREPRNQVLAIYRKAGLEKVADFKEPEDHLAIELEFMSYLCLKTKEALDNKDNAAALRLLKTQADFHKKHLISWVPAFCDDITNGSAKFDFYKIMGVITRGYIEAEEKTIAGLIEESGKTSSPAARARRKGQGKSA